MALAEAGERGRDHRRGPGGEGGDRQRPRVEAAQGVQFALGAAEGGEDLPRASDEQRPRVRDRDSLREALQQLNAGFRLKDGDLAGDGRLGVAECGRGRRQ